MKAIAALAALIVALSGCAAEASPPTARLDVKMSPHGIAWAELGAGEPLLLLNGTGSPMSEWDPAFLERLSQRARVIVFDYPGLGQSSAPARDSFAGIASAVSQLLTDIGVQRADVLGWSMGGFVAQHLLRSASGQVDRAVLMGTNPGGPRTVLGPDWVQRADSDPDAGLRTYLRTNYPHRRCAQAAGRRFLDRLAAAQESGRYPASRVPARTYRLMVAAENPWLRSGRNLRELSSVRAPVLVLVGGRDVITPPRNSRILAEAIPGAQLVRVPAAGHSVAFQAPVVVADAVTDFLAGEPVPRTLRTRCAR